MTAATSRVARRAVDRAGLAALDPVRAAGGRVALVPTMGALHDGARDARSSARHELADLVVVSIFVNPLQFGPGEDFDRYPRDLDADLALCARRGRRRGVRPVGRGDVPDGEPLVRVRAGPLGDGAGGRRAGPGTSTAC